MKKSIFIVVFSLTMTFVAYARDWGFSKDTVHVLIPADNHAFLMNQGTDTLRIDSILFDVIRQVTPPQPMDYKFTLVSYLGHQVGYGGQGEAINPPIPIP